VNQSIHAAMQESFDVSRQVLADLIRLIDGIIAGAIGHPAAPVRLSESFSRRPETQRVLPAMLQGLGSSSNTLVRLSDRPGLQSRDCFSICRSIVELAVNICYILAEGESAASRAKRHASQKAIRDLDRKSTVGDETIHLRSAALSDLKLPQGVEESIHEFTALSGREKGWTDLNIDARCEKISQILGSKVLTPLHWARFAVYRHSSEILHGTFFSAAFFIGLTESRSAPASPEEWLNRISGQHLMILMSTVLSLLAVVRAVNATFDTPDLMIQAERQMSDLKAAPFFRGESKETNDV
jgi:hypothetical protein